MVFFDVLPFLGVSSEDVLERPWLTGRGVRGALVFFWQRGKCCVFCWDALCKQGLSGSKPKMCQKYFEHPEATDLSFAASTSHFQ